MDTINYCQFYYVKRGLELLNDFSRNTALGMQYLSQFLATCFAFLAVFFHEQLFKSEKSFRKDRMQEEIIQVCIDVGEMRTKSKSISILKHSERPHIYQKKDQTLNNSRQC